MLGRPGWTATLITGGGDKGVWQPTECYFVHDRVWFSGLTWVCLTGCRGVKPGSEPRAWRAIRPEAAKEE